MGTFLQNQLGLSLDDAQFLIAVAGLLIALVGIVPPIRRGVATIFGVRAGGYERRYTRSFLTNHGKIIDVYMRTNHELNLDTTYVSLSFNEIGVQAGRYILATQLLASTEIKRIIITGDPGSGKSTLLRAYGAGVLRRRRRHDASDLRSIPRSGEIPIFISLRHFARVVKDNDPNALVDYLTSDVLRKSGVGNGRGFLKWLLKHDRCLVLLDGLDEVPEAQRAAVEQAILSFAGDTSSEMPTTRARIMLSCRRQNFARMERQWIPTFANTTHMISPLGDTEIRRYLSKRRTEFRPPRTADRFYDTIRTSSAMDLHRAPLILAISAGLYINLAAYEIPRSIGRFYSEMMTELLVRHNHEGVAEQSRFDMEDKLTFLQQFAYDMAKRGDRFDDFTVHEVVEDATQVCRRLTTVDETSVRAFVKELLERSGLFQIASGLAERLHDEDNYLLVGKSLEYTFAHRSIHEYLIALHLASSVEGGWRELLEQANDEQWYHVIELFAALQPPRLDDFLKDLSTRNLPLAGHCLAGARTSIEIARPILNRLAERLRRGNPDIIATHLPALVASVRASSPAIADLARNLVQAAVFELSEIGQVGSLVRDRQVIIDLVDRLSYGRESDGPVLVAAFASLLPDPDPKLVAPLWRSLVSAADSQTDSSRSIVRWLLDAITSVPCFIELQRQPATSVGDDAIRRVAYPFERGVQLDSNLPALLVIADRLSAVQTQPNRFFQAKGAGVLAKIERARRGSISFVPYRTARIVYVTAWLTAFVLAAFFMISDWQRPNWGTVGLWLGPLVCSFIVAATLGTIGPRFGMTDFRTADIKGPNVDLFHTKPSRSAIVPGSTIGGGIGVYLVLRFVSRVGADDLTRYFWAAIVVVLCIVGGAIVGRFLYFAAGYVTVASLGRYGNQAGVANPLPMWFTRRANPDRSRLLRGNLLAAPYAVVYILALAPLENVSFWIFFSATTITILIFFWLPATKYFERDRRFYLRRPNEYVDIYDDPRSRHWVIRTATAR